MPGHKKITTRERVTQQISNLPSEENLVELWQNADNTFNQASDLIDNPDGRIDLNDEMDLNDDTETIPSLLQKAIAQYQDITDHIPPLGKPLAYYFFKLEQFITFTTVFNFYFFSEEASADELAIFLTTINLATLVETLEDHIPEELEENFSQHTASLRDKLKELEENADKKFNQAQQDATSCQRLLTISAKQYKKILLIAEILYSTEILPLYLRYLSVQQKLLPFDTHAAEGMLNVIAKIEKQTAYRDIDEDLAQKLADARASIAAQQQARTQEKRKFNDCASQTQWPEKNFTDFTSQTETPADQADPEAPTAKRATLDREEEKEVNRAPKAAAHELFYDTIKTCSNNGIVPRQALHWLAITLGFDASRLTQLYKADRQSKIIDRQLAWYLFEYNITEFKSEKAKSNQAQLKLEPQLAAPDLGFINKLKDVPKEDQAQAKFLIIIRWLSNAIKIKYFNDECIPNQIFIDFLNRFLRERETLGLGPSSIETIKTAIDQLQKNITTLKQQQTPATAPQPRALTRR